MGGVSVILDLSIKQWEIHACSRNAKDAVTSRLWSRLLRARVPYIVYRCSNPLPAVYFVGLGFVSTSIRFHALRHSWCSNAGRDASALYHGDRNYVLLSVLTYA